MIKLGIDIGSTTAKAVAINEEKRILFTKYERHNTKVKERIIEFLSELRETIGTETISINITGTIGLGVAERCKLPFLQEVVAAAKAISTNYRHAKAMIDIGGEDAKVVFFNEGETTDLRMNGNCAGGTGAFIDQMAIILGVTIPELNELALKATELYPIAARCGVFSKTDIQNLVAKNVSRENIAASIFRAVAVQTVVTLAHGSKIDTPVLLCGGPLTYIPALRKAFVDYLAVTNNDIILPENGTLMPALGCALYSKGNEKTFTANELIEIINKNLGIRSFEHSPLPKLFANSDDYSHWKERISCNHIPMIQLKEGIQEAFLGIDSGSTTTKIVLLDKECRMLYSDYLPNQGTPIATVEKSLKQLAQACKNAKTELKILGSYSTGYGEDLIRTAFQLHGGIIETIAHYMAALHLDKEVSFILDIGGQDMKAIFVNNGIIDRMEINEACSSGCGSFIETFAKSLGYTAAEFAENAWGPNSTSGRADAVPG